MISKSLHKEESYTSSSDWLSYQQTRDVALRNKIASQNYRLVRKVAGRYLERVPMMYHDDLFQEGFLGLLKAVELFDYAKGFQFSTYAYYWIRQAIDRYIKNHTLVIRLPVHQRDALLRLKKNELAFEQEYCRPPSLVELAEFCNVSFSRITELFEARQVASARSLNATLKEGGTTSLADLCADTETLDPLEAFLAKGQRLLPAGISLEVFNRALEQLPERSFEILIMRAHDRTLEDIAELYGITRERVRQIEAAALKRVRTKLGYAKEGELIYKVGPPASEVLEASRKKRGSKKATPRKITRSVRTEEVSMRDQLKNALKRIQNKEK